MTDDLIAFLRARLDEDERNVKRLRELAAEDNAWRDGEEEEPQVDRYMTDLEAKRRIVNYAEHAHNISEGNDAPSGDHIGAFDRGYRLGQWHGYHAVLRMLAAPYADHADYPRGMVRP